MGSFIHSIDTEIIIKQVPYALNHALNVNEELELLNSMLVWTFDNNVALISVRLVLGLWFDGKDGLARERLITIISLLQKTAWNGN